MFEKSNHACLGLHTSNEKINASWDEQTHRIVLKWLAS